MTIRDVVAVPGRVLRWREGGADYAEIGRRFGRSPNFMDRVEGYASYKLHRS